MSNRHFSVKLLKFCENCLGWSRQNCPNCLSFHNSVNPQLNKPFILLETITIVFIFVHFRLLFSCFFAALIYSKTHANPHHVLLCAASAPCPRHRFLCLFCTISACKFFSSKSLLTTRLTKPTFFWNRQFAKELLNYKQSKGSLLSNARGKWRQWQVQPLQSSS